jgi:SulP family sulfate permease
VLIKGIQPRHEDLFRTVGVLAAPAHHNHLFDRPACDRARPQPRAPQTTTA